MTTHVRAVWNVGIFIAATLAGLSVICLLILHALTFPLAPHDVHVFTWGLCTGTVVTLLPVAVLVATWIVARRARNRNS